MSVRMKYLCLHSYSLPPPPPPIYIPRSRHPNIIAYVDSFIERGSLNIVMNYADSGDLGDYIKRRATVRYVTMLTELTSIKIETNVR